VCHRCGLLKVDGEIGLGSGLYGMVGCLYHMVGYYLLIQLLFALMAQICCFEVINVGINVVAARSNGIDLLFWGYCCWFLMLMLLGPIAHIYNFGI
jgi:hypothetical protein